MVEGKVQGDNEGDRSDEDGSGKRLAPPVKNDHTRARREISHGLGSGWVLLEVRSGVAVPRRSPLGSQRRRALRGWHKDEMKGGGEGRAWR